MYSLFLYNQHNNLPSFNSDFESKDSNSDNSVFNLISNLSFPSINIGEENTGINIKKRKFEQTTPELFESTKKIKKMKLLENDIDTKNEFPAINAKKFYKELSLNNPKIKMLDYSPLCCRFNDIPCPKETHIKLDHEKDDLYLHANQVVLNDRQFIATQYPMIYEAMDFKLCESFWKMSAKGNLIVDLTNSSDQKKGLTKYAPEEEDDELGYGNTFIVCTNKESMSSLNATYYQYSVETENEEEVSVDRLHFENWPDQQALDVNQLDELVNIVNDKQKNP
ncbi:MAG: protein-tyrosine phosphatase family protein, partial [Parachlamydiaceae bacterium]|nr:protein-tyrosine phosphatase family protein [Parachlamydiaceae bacterium]